MSVLSICTKAFLKGKKIVFFGAGESAFSAMRNTKPLLSYFCDNAPNKQGSMFWGVPVYHPNKLLEEDKDNLLIVIVAGTYEEVAEQLFSMGFKEVYSELYKSANEKIPHTAIDSRKKLQMKAESISGYDVNKVRDLFADELSKKTFDGIIEKYKKGNVNFSDIRTNDTIYFNDIFRDDMSESEIYVDAGTYDGKTVVDFIFYSKGNYKKIYAFEPDIINYYSFYREFSDFHNIVISQSGLSDIDGEVFFDAQGTHGSKIVGDNGNFRRDDFAKINVVKLDTCVNEPVTFIKMDIEGGEYNALIGAQKTIMMHKPKLAISVYHEDEDLVRIPLLIHEMAPEYKFYLRHHKFSHVDTVLYAKNI